MCSLTNFFVAMFMLIGAWVVTYKYVLKKYTLISVVQCSLVVNVLVFILILFFGNYVFILVIVSNVIEW